MLHDIFVMELRGNRAMRNLWRFIVRVHKGLDRNYCFDMSAELGFYFLFSVFPFFIFFVAILGYLPIPATPEEVLSALRKFLPEYLFTLAGPAVLDIVFRPRRWVALGTLVLALWVASLAVSSLMASLNRIYGIKERRVYWRRKGISLLLTAAHVGILLIAFVLLVIGPVIKDWLISYVGFHSQINTLFGATRWLIVVAVMFFDVAIIFSFGPSAKKPFKIVTPGCFVTIAGWFVFSEAFGLYFKNIGPRNLFYGAVGGIIGLMTWLYVMGLMILVGAQVNRELERNARFSKLRD